MFVRTFASAIILGASLTACGGGGSSNSTLPAAPAAKATSTALQSVLMRVHIPSASAASSAVKRRALYVSLNTQSAVVTVTGETPQLINLSATSPNCTATAGGRTCTATISAPPGTDSIAETLYASVDGSGQPLSTNTTSATIVAGTANVVNITLDGIVASIGLVLGDATPPVGTKAVIPLTVTFNDASGAAIVGSDPFSNPITLTDSDTSGSTSLSKTSLLSPQDAASIAVTYSGAALARATFGATATGATSASATLTPNGTSGTVGFNDYTTYGYDNQRDIYNPNSTAITPANVAGLHLAWQKTMNSGNGDYNVQAQPVLATEIPNHAGVLFIAGGGTGSIEAFDALSGTQLWSTSTGQEQFTCDGGGTAYFGAAGTVAYDPATRSLYAATNSNNAPNAFAANSLVRLDGASGAIESQYNFGAGQIGAGEINFAHTAVTLANGIAYVGTGSTCDIPSWRGRVAGINVATMTGAGTFFPVWNAQTNWGGGGIWGWGGVSIDFNGNVVTGVGNADNSTSGFKPPFVAAPTEYSALAETLTQVSPDLSTVLASNHPIPTSAYGGVSSDLDLQGTPAIFKPLGTGCDTMAAVQGKSGTLFIYDETQIGAGPKAQFQLSPSQYEDGYIGDPAFSQATGLVYASVASNVSPTLFAPGMIAVNPGCGSPSVAWHAAFGPDSSGGGVPRSAPAVSAGGVVFIATTCAATSGTCGGSASLGDYGALWMVNASDGTVLNGGAPVLYTNAYIRAPATIDGNWVYVVDAAGDIYGLTIDPKYPTVAAKRRSVNTQLFFHRKKLIPTP